MVINYPDSYKAPIPLLTPEGNCGLIATWSVCRYFRKRISSSRIITSCRYTKTHGVFTIAMAVALHEFGFCVSFCTDPDPTPEPIEKRCYKVAESLNLSIAPAIELDTLLERIDENHIAIVLFEENRSAHFSPLLGSRNSKLILPYSYGGEVEKDEFIPSWNARGIYRQCIIVSQA